MGFALPALSATNIMTRKCHLYDSAKGRYEIILGRNILIELGLNLKCTKLVIKEEDGHFLGVTAPMVGLVSYVFKNLNTRKLNRKNILLVLMSKKYMNQNISVLQINDCA